ncbi:acyl-CoA dehydrogenase [Piscinibacter sakaiensis]|uniref:acyl-CoA dehydrogenase n=1 Tax=Piscinibacter sakaiensis TaxID=1547922 RepID=UPI003AAD5C99
MLTAEVMSAADPADALRRLIDSGADRLPLPGSGRTLERWRALSDVAARDLALVKLFDGHTDALAILAELGQRDAAPPGSSWGTWAAEAPGARVIASRQAGGDWRLDGRKSWCSGARFLSHALLTVWLADGDGPWLARVELRQPGVSFDAEPWQAVGMADSASIDVVFDGAAAELVGRSGDYLSRPGFWHGGAGIAACWYGGALGIAGVLRSAVRRAAEHAKAGDQAAAFRAAALGRVDLALAQTAALLRAAAAWIDAHPQADAQALALRVRLSADAMARCVLDEVARALGPAPFCRDAAMARRLADLPVFIRQSGADRDAAALGSWAADQTEADPWAL